MADTITTSSTELPVSEKVVAAADAVPATSSDAPAKTAEEPAVDETAPKPLAEEPPAEPAAEAANGETQDTTMDIAAEVAEEPTAGANGATPASSKKKEKRKSTSGVPEHKAKKLNRKKSTVELHLNVQPGDFWFVQMKGYPPWPAVICDEEMLPITLLDKRPVSAARADGTYRADFEEGGKNARDRRYPVMFLGTNEFAWHVNTDLSPLSMEDVKSTVAEGKQGKKSKTLWDAYKVAVEDHDLAYFKNMLAEHEERRRQIEQEEAERAAKKAAKEAKKKSKEAADEDEEMEDVEEEEGGKPAKSSKKRKKDVDSDGENGKPSKTPKMKLKVNGPKTPAEDSVSKPKKSSKPKKAKAKGDDDAEAAPAEPEQTEEEKREKKEKMILYLRHKLQKGFLSRDHSPKEEEMDSMNQQMKQLEQYLDLDAGIIKSTKINKVLKAILKLDEIPLESTYNFKDRSSHLLAAWAPALGLDPSTAGAEPSAPKEPTTNGVTHEKSEPEGPVEVPKEEPATTKDEPEPAAAAEPVESAETAETAEPPSTDANEPKTDADVSMTDPPAEPIPTEETAAAA